MTLHATPRPAGQIRRRVLTASGAVVLAAGAIAGGGAALAPTAAAAANTVRLSAGPTILPATGRATATITATVTGSGGSPVGNDLVTFSTAAAAAACGTIAPGSSTTGSSGSRNGVASATYTAATSPGACVVTATEQAGGGAGTVRITETVDHVVVVADPTSLPPDGRSQSVITATVTGPAGAAVGDAVTFRVSPGACGSMLSPSVNTNLRGRARTVYTASTTPGACTITAVDATHGGSASATLVQAAAAIVVVAASPPTLPANGGARTTISATVRNAAGALVPNDLVSFAVVGSDPACGTIAPARAATGSRGGRDGVAAVRYTSSIVVGGCTVTAIEAQRHRSGAATVTQTGDRVDVVATPAILPADGRSRSSVTAAVTDASGYAVGGDWVHFTVGRSGCGTVAPTGATSSGSGQARTTYTASDTAAVCTITAVDVVHGGSGTATITQGGVAAVVLAVSPASLPADGRSTAVVNATVTHPNGSPVVGDGVSFTTSGPGCGSLRPGYATTGGEGQARTTYTASAVPGPCTITAIESRQHRLGAVVITQTQVVAPPAAGYWLATATGHVYQFGTARFRGSLPSLGVRASDVVALAAVPNGGGYWLATATGHVYPFGTARFYGSPYSRGVRLADVVSLAAAPSGRGYWVATRDGHVFQYGSVPFAGSPFSHGLRLHDVVGLGAAASGQGYWVASADGHVFQFGQVPFLGSPVSRRAELTGVVGLAAAPRGAGYWVLTRTGAIDGFGQAPASGSPAGQGLSDVVGMAATASGRGLWVTTATGAVLPYGAAAAAGSASTRGLTLTDVVAIGRA